MRILLGSNALYYPAHGGGERSNRMVLEGLAARGHKCLVVTRLDKFSAEAEAAFTTDLQTRGIQLNRAADRVHFLLNGVDVVVATTVPSFRAFFTEHKNAFAPDIILTSTDDPAQLLLEAALKDAHAATVFLTRATVALPFGPDAAFISREKTELLRQADAIVGVSNYVARYIQDHAGIPAVHVPIAPVEPGPHPQVGRFDAPFVSLANPCAVKGISIFLALARALPGVQFAGVPTWGTTPEDIAAMQAVPNITVVPRVDRINDLLAQTRVLLVPSVWAEARSRIVVEGMLAGVPVMTSNLGGLPEAKMGIPYILPVTPIETYHPSLDEKFVPVAQVPPQDITPWHNALVRLLYDRDHWTEIAEASRAAALHYAETSTVEQLEQLLANLNRKQRSFASNQVAMPSEQIARLSPERQRLLALKLRAQASAPSNAPVLPFGGVEAGKLALFCFPHAGGGAGFFRFLRQTSNLPAGAAPVQYPGHENRRAEQFAQTMHDLVTKLARDLDPFLNGRFAFLGHSMGAIAAFELTRLLRRQGRPLPALLIASAARAPQFRRGHIPPPDPSREELIKQVRELGGLPPDIIASDDSVQILLPALDADTSLYRRYIYSEDEPLPVSILALGGAADPNIEPHHLQGWREQTTAAFETRQFAGAHFYLRENEDQFLSTISAALSPLT